MNKKFLKIILIIFILLIILVAGFKVYLFLQQEEEEGGEVSEAEQELPEFFDYYRDLSERCEEKSSLTCCMDSVESMFEGGYKIKPEAGCDEGFRVNQLRCEDSYVWCEPVK